MSAVQSTTVKVSLVNDASATQLNCDPNKAQLRARVSHLILCFCSPSPVQGILGGMVSSGIRSFDEQARNKQRRQIMGQMANKR